jgi:flagellar assembly protein FliH
MFEAGRLEPAPPPAMATDGFVAGLAARHDAAAVALRRAFADRAEHGFAPADLIARIARAEKRPAPESGPRHFSPENRDENPTAGWNPLDPDEPATGFIDPVEAAHAAGYTEGLAAAKAAVEEAGARDKAFLGELLDKLQAGDRIDREAVASRLRQTVLLLVGKVVGEVGVSPDLLAARVEAAAEMLADAGESAMLRVNPEDVDLIKDRMPKTIFAVGDAAIARGTFVLEAASTVIEDGPALWLEQLEAMIDRLPVPRG